MDFGFDILDSVGGLDPKGDSLSGESLDKDLHSSEETEDKMEGRLFWDVVIGKSPVIFELIASKSKFWIVRKLALDFFNFGFDGLHGHRWLDLERDRLAGEGLHENLHFEN